METSFFQTSVTLQVCTLLFISSCSFVLAHINNYPTKSYCHIQNHTANCSDHGRNLTYFPKLPSTVQSIYFNRNYIPFVDNATFANISVENIHSLSMGFDGIRKIASNPFSSFVNLTNLDISGNNITVDQLEDLLHGLAKMTRLDHLILNSMSLLLPQNMFYRMNGSRLSYVFLKSNGIRNVTKYMFQNLKKLQLINLDNNQIEHIQLPVLKYLKTIHASFNDLKNVPSFCVANNTNSSIAPRLMNLYIRRNKIRNVNEMSFKCLHKLRTLDLSGNYLLEFPNDILSQLTNIRQLALNYMDATTFKIHPFAFRSMSLRYLKILLTVSARQEDVFVSANETFAYSPNLEFLYLDSITFYRATDKSMAQMFVHLSNLKRLSLVRCQIEFTPIEMLANKPKLDKLILSYNLITSVRFSNLEQLLELNLAYNLIQHFDQNNLPSTKLKILDMSGNPFICQCELGWFTGWLREKNKNVDVKHYKNYTCAYPPNMKGKRLADVSFTYRECHPWGIDFWVGVIGGPTVFAIAVIAIVIYRNRWNIKHYIYLMKKRRHYENIEGREFIYDAFVGYNQNDYEWVIEHLLPTLETQEGYTLCIHDRNFKPGKYIHDNIITCMEASRKIILVLTNEFAKSGWCTYEIKLAHTKHIEDETDLIVIMLQRPNARYMNKSLKVLLETTTFIEWTDNDIGRQLFWDKLKDAMKRQ